MMEDEVGAVATEGEQRSKPETIHALRLFPHWRLHLQERSPPNTCRHSCSSDIST
ncbi:hypothetical protein SAY86_015973 [Trapa natans]|uniref:Uncharacterized protein n=1 Tax=Trapa natans TaxID=22666 RepID=A0AAN7L9I9_TRANT|nr:hypothetical protein SAY86_015973 [Trapa natans]